MFIYPLIPSFLCFCRFTFFIFFCRMRVYYFLVLFALVWHISSCASFSSSFSSPALVHRGLKESLSDAPPPFNPDENSVIILSLLRFKKWYYQFNDSLYHTLKMTLGLSVLQLFDEASLVKNGKRGDILIVLNNPIDLRFTKLHVTARQAMYHTILYETESMQFRKKRSLDTLYDIYRPAAIWTYSMFNVDGLVERGVKNAFFVPPAYSPTCDYRAHEKAHSSNLPITFVERWVGGKRVQPLADQNISFENVHAWTDEEYASNVASHTILINVHKVSMKPVEMFRLAPALSSGMHVISEPAYERDEALLSPFVTFREVEEMREVIDAWVEEGEDPERRKKAADDIASRFKKDFSLCSFVVKGLAALVPSLREEDCF